MAVMETVIIFKEVAKVLLLGALGLCVIVAIGLVSLFPHLLRLVGNLAAAASKISGDFADVSADVARADSGLRRNDGLKALELRRKVFPIQSETLP